MGAAQGAVLSHWESPGLLTIAALLGIYGALLYWQPGLLLPWIPDLVGCF